MIACVDVHYRGKDAVAACILFRDWPDAAGAGHCIEHACGVRQYEPGRFYLRELPCLLAVLRKVTEPLECVVIDGYVWLDEKGAPGLGAHLFEALGCSVPVIGVAKSRFRAAGIGREVFRGGSGRPLYVTAAGIDPDTAARCIVNMHGDHRIPTLLRQADRLCRSG